MRTLPAAALTAALVIAPAALAWAGGSDDVTPYQVTAEGIQLPDGDVFPDNGHVNVRASKNGAQIGQAHFEGKCVDRTDAECAGTRHEVAQYIGQGFIPWAALGVAAGECVGWVQVSHYDEHFGEGGQEPVCLETSAPEETPEPVVTPEPKPTPEFPDTPPVVPGEPVEPGTDPTPTEPTEGTEPTEPVAPSESPAPVVDEGDDTGESDGTIGRPQGVAVTPGAPDASGDAAEVSARSAEQVRAQTTAELPQTGATVTGVVVAAVALVLGGLGVLTVRRRRRA
ncbi:LPXTG-motif cell wall-anchored protein [Isoptericola sp. CG 20/1183]|uniref:LPXTG-motif cell wall-anchored protein n=1 Tax=Isoptericola halotolerans TaxID=300560 RepID=A0ABX5EKM5_9MICO|nr:MULTISPECIES: LPXTG cell wall anchor domain-containing protein [Isoptericola]PRZ09475.1 LPXTG-motif cell wall-anchored protein [Isoptericola sp. CG 20/1183]PRZ10276.1 LPXTG-motif cell wall-anchored protein [Isoptericola halotolerans]